MIDNLLKAKKITPQQHDQYMLFNGSELGRRVLDDMMHTTFMDEPAGKDFKGVGFAFYDGRRSVVRDIHRTILNVQKIIKESLDDNQS